MGPKDSMKKTISHEPKNERKTKSKKKDQRISSPSNKSVKISFPKSVSPSLGGRRTKSRRFLSEIPEIQAFSYLDYIYLILYFLALYTLYAAFWISLWSIYIGLKRGSEKTSYNSTHYKKVLSASRSFLNPRVCKEDLKA